MALSWKTSAIITNIASQPLSGTVDVAEVESAIAAVHEAGDVGGNSIKEVVEYDTKVSKRRSTGIHVAEPTKSFTDDEWTRLGPNEGRAYVTQH